MWRWNLRRIPRPLRARLQVPLPRPRNKVAFTTYVINHVIIKSSITLLLKNVGVVPSIDRLGQTRTYCAALDIVDDYFFEFPFVFDLTLSLN